VEQSPSENVSHSASQEIPRHTTGPYHEPDESNPQLPTLFP